MHPANSVILFTTASGIGFGMLFFLGLGYPKVTGVTAFMLFALAYVLTIGGLVSSVFHLGRPERAIKAFSQWKTSWLSREGWASVATLVVMAMFGAGLVFLKTSWPIMGIVGSIFAIVAVYCTSMIYKQLKTVPRWYNSLTPILYLTFSLAGGSFIGGNIILTAVLLIALLIVQCTWWYYGDHALKNSGTDIGTATGLGHLGKIRAFEPPHTGTNYLMNEMVHIVARKHVIKLRVISIVLTVLLPILFLLFSNATMMIGLAMIVHLVGVTVSRWLFFAEAEHVVGIYYGKR